MPFKKSGSASLRLRWTSLSRSIQSLVCCLVWWPSKISESVCGRMPLLNSGSIQSISCLSTPARCVKKAGNVSPTECGKSGSTFES